MAAVMRYYSRYERMKRSNNKLLHCREEIKTESTNGPIRKSSGLRIKYIAQIKWAEATKTILLTKISPDKSSLCLHYAFYHVTVSLISNTCTYISFISNTCTSYKPIQGLIKIYQSVIVGEKSYLRCRICHLKIIPDKFPTIVFSISTISSHFLLIRC